MQKDFAVSLCLQQPRNKMPSVYSDASQDQTMPFCTNLCKRNWKTCDHLWKNDKKQSSLKRKLVSLLYFGLLWLVIASTRIFNAWYLSLMFAPLLPLFYLCPSLFWVFACCWCDLIQCFNKFYSLLCGSHSFSCTCRKMVQYIKMTTCTTDVLFVVSMWMSF